MTSTLSRSGQRLRDLGAGAQARLRLLAGRPVRFRGAFADRAAALASLPETRQAAYDQDGVADISYEAMCQVVPWDYPVLYWLNRLIADQPSENGPLSVLDAGGHMGTKYTAFGAHLPLERTAWHVWDLPAILRAGRDLQGQGRLPDAIRFQDQPADAGPVDVLLASGLLQYLDQPLQHLIDQMATPPRWIILNKVAQRPGPTVVTLERIGPALVPYQIRGQDVWAAELSQLAYEVVDSWDIPSLSHRINTHPWLGPSQSRGYVLKRCDPADGDK